MGTSRTSKVDKKGNFKRIAEARTNKLLDALVFDAIQEELDNQRKRFSEEEHKKRKFRL